jgi:hypothetical protein
VQDFRLFNPDVRNLNAKLPVGYYVILPGNDGEIDDLISAITLKTSRTRRFGAKNRSRSSVARRR